MEATVLRSAVKPEKAKYSCSGEFSIEIRRRARKGSELTH